MKDNPLASPNRINLASTIPCTEAEGPGKRFAIWVQGCPFRCKGCCNPHMLEFIEKEWITPEKLAQQVLFTPDIEGITLLGGEPFAQASALTLLCRILREKGLSVMVFSGHSLAQLQKANRTDWNEFLSEIDLLVDGLYIQSLHTTSRRWIGSTNQTIHYLTSRYENRKEADGSWEQGGNTMEIRMRGNQIWINGFPLSEWTQKLAQESVLHKGNDHERN